MRSFAEIHQIAALRKGGVQQLERLINTSVAEAAPAQITDRDWLEAMAKALFQAGFNWSLIEEKWPSFRKAFDDFDVVAITHYNDEDIDRLLADKSIVRNGAKIAAVVKNARWLHQLGSKYGSASEYLADWPTEDFAGLLELFEKEGSRLGGVTGQRVCRMVGKDGYVLSPDVCKRLIAEGVIDKPPTSKSAMRSVQSAFNQWRSESGRDLTELSRILALSVD